jgi:hypothetical protein
VKLDKETSKIAQMQQELADLVKQYGKNAYKLSDEGFDVSESELPKFKITLH